MSVESLWPTLKEKKLVWEACGYDPWPAQIPFHQESLPMAQLVGAEGAGKSLMTAGELVGAVPSSRLIYLAGDNYDNTHPEFNYLQGMLAKTGFVSEQKVSKPKGRGWEMTCYNGCEVRTISVQRGAEQIISLGQEPDVIAIVEAGIIQSTTILYASHQRVTRSRGRVLLSGTLRDPFSWYATMRDELSVKDNAWGGKTFSLPAWSNKLKYPGGENDPQIVKLRETLPEDYFAMTVAATTIPSKALVLTEFTYGDHVGPCHFEPELPTELWIDPGYFPSAYAVVVVQWHGDVAWQIDEIYENFKTDEEIVVQASERPWWVTVRGLVMDTAARQHNTRSQKSSAEVWESELGLFAQSAHVGVLDGIARHRSALKQRRIRHDTKCLNTLAEYTAYRKPTNKHDEVTSETPLDANNHCIRGDTLIDTPGGRVPIQDLAGTEPYVYCIVDGNLAVRKANNVKMTRRDAPVVKLVMDRGEIVCTPDHLFMLSNGSYVEAQALRPGQSLMSLNRTVSNDGYTRIYITGQSRRTLAEHRFVYEQVHGPIPEGYHVHHQDGQRWNHDPGNLESVSLEQHASQHHKGKIISFQQRQQISSASKRQWQQNYDARAEIARTNAVAAHAANVGRPQGEAERKKRSEASKRTWSDPDQRQKASDRGRGKRHSREAKEKVREAKKAYWSSPKGLEHRRRIAEQNRQHGKIVGANHKVIAVIPWGATDVYDMTVPDAHNFVANQVVIHNSMKCIAYGLINKLGLSERARRIPVGVRPVREPWQGYR